MPRADGSPTTTERGYGHTHAKARKRMAVIVDRGQAVCSRCLRLIVPGTKWHLDHTPDRTGYLGPAHAACNTAAGARVGNRRRSKRAQVLRLVISRTW